MKLQNKNLVGQTSNEKDEHIFECHDKIETLEAENARLKQENLDLVKALEELGRILLPKNYSTSTVQRAVKNIITKALKGGE